MMNGATLTLADLAYRPMWVGWKKVIRHGKSTKLPYDPVTGDLAKSDNSQSWATYNEAELWALENSVGSSGVFGLMCAPVDDTLHIGGADLDSCRTPETGEA